MGDDPAAAPRHPGAADRGHPPGVPAEQQALVAATGFASWDELRAKFKARIVESVTRIRAVKAVVGQATSHMGTGPAKNASASLVGEYRELAN